MIKPHWSSHLMQRCIEEVGKLQEVSDGVLCRLGGQTDVVFGGFQPVNMQSEQLSVHIELGE